MDKDKQGPHVDPSDPKTAPIDRSTWTQLQREAFTSEAMSAYRNALLLDGREDVRSAIVDDLATFHQISPEQCIDRCINWEQWSVDEWQARPRDTREGLADFYAKVKSWNFDLLWFAYLQAEGYAYPISVVAANGVPKPRNERPRHLDFGSGVGVTSQMFLNLGYETDLADISDTMLAFARFRLERRAQKAAFIDLRTEILQPNRYDVITAFDTLTYIPEVEFDSSVAMLHGSLRPGGHLVANFDTRAPSPENAWHLYSDDRQLRFRLHRTGFEPVAKLDSGYAVYIRVDPSGSRHLARGLRDLVMLRSPLRSTYRRVRGLLTKLRGRARGDSASRGVSA